MPGVAPRGTAYPQEIPFVLNPSGAAIRPVFLGKTDPRGQPTPVSGSLVGPTAKRNGSSLGLGEFGV